MDKKEYIERGAICKIISEAAILKHSLSKEAEARGLFSALYKIRKFPAADVVPREEFEHIKQMYEAAVAGQETLQKHMRSLIAEIEKIHERIYNSYVFECNDYSEDDVAIECAINYGTDFANGLDELKEKYTGASDENKS